VLIIKVDKEVVKGRKAVGSPISVGRPELIEGNRAMLWKTSGAFDVR
jgi:hypothetical protein